MLKTARNSRVVTTGAATASVRMPRKRLTSRSYRVHMPRQLTPRGASGKLAPTLKLGAARPGDGAGSLGMESGGDDRQATANRQGRRGKRQPKRPDRASL